MDLTTNRDPAAESEPTTNPDPTREGPIDEASAEACRLRRSRGGCSRSLSVGSAGSRVERMYESSDSQNPEEAISILPDEAATCEAAPDNEMPIYRHLAMLTELTEALEKAVPERIAAAVNRMTTQERRDYVDWENSIYTTTVKLYLDSGCQLVLYDESAQYGIGVNGTGRLYCVRKDDKGKFRLHHNVCAVAELLARLQNLGDARTGNGLADPELPAYICWLYAAIPSKAN